VKPWPLRRRAFDARPSAFDLPGSAIGEGSASYVCRKVSDLRLVLFSGRGDKMGANGQRQTTWSSAWRLAAMSAKSGPALSDSTSLTQPVTDAGQAGVNASSSALPRATATGSPCPTDGNAALAESPGQISISTTEPVGTVQVVASQNAAAASDSAPPGAEVQEMPSSAAQVAATPPARPDGRAADELRPIQIVRPAWGSAPGRVIFCMGRTAVLCTCSVEPTVPPFLVGTGKGWLTAEYNMLPGSTAPRKARVSLKPDGRSVEIQRLIGRSLRTCLNLEKLGERTLWIDCDVLEADGGTRTASINGGFLALVDALVALRDQLPNPLSEILTGSVAAVSVGLWHGQRILDLNYAEDKDAAVDLNLVMTGDGRLVEVQAGGEEDTFALEDLQALLELGRRGIARILDRLRQTLGEYWPGSPQPLADGSPQRLSSECGTPS
jgi:ribonuclease PH